MTNMVQIRQNVVHALLYLISVIFPIAVIFGGSKVDEDTRYHSVQALILQAIQIVLAILVFCISLILNLIAAFTETGRYSMLTGVFRAFSGFFTALPWVMQGLLVILAILAFFEKTFRLPLVDSLADRITPKIYRRANRHSSDT